MTIKKLMIPFLELETGQRAFNVGAVFAKAFNAHLDVVHMRQRITASLPDNIYYPIPATNIEENFHILTEAANQIAAGLKREFERLCGDRSVGILEQVGHADDRGATAFWDDVEKTLPHDLAMRARVADMTVLARPDNHAQSHTMDLIEEIIFQSGQPVLIVGEDSAMREFPKTVMVAWDGGREAARAVSTALPILKHAEIVIVVAVGDLVWGAEPPQSVAAFLKLHGVHAVHMHPSLQKHDEAEEVLLGHAKSKTADLIVMGAYSRSRWREVVLGGFTRFLLRHSDIPLLMAH